MKDVNEYAKEKGISRQAVMKQIFKGQLNVKKEGSKWYIKWYIVVPEVQPTATKAVQLQPTATEVQPEVAQATDNQTGVWLALSRLAKRIEMLEAEVAKMKRDGIIHSVVAGKGRTALAPKRADIREMIRRAKMDWGEEGL